MHLEHLARAAVAITTAAAAWLGNTVAQATAPGEPWTVWLDRYGLPLTMLGLALVVIRYLYLANRDLQSARIKDRDDALTQYKADNEKSEQSRAKLYGSIDRLSDEFRGLKEELRRGKHPSD